MPHIIIIIRRGPGGGAENFSHWMRTNIIHHITTYYTPL